MVGSAFRGAVNHADSVDYFWWICGLGILGGRQRRRRVRRVRLPAASAFVVRWFLVAAVNMYFGVAKAGYAFQEELPIFLAIFLLPAIAAMVSQRWLR
jgi:hypothetical protein